MSGGNGSKIWRLRSEREVPARDAAAIAEECDISERLARILLLRGISTPAEAQSYLDARLSRLEPPKKWQGMPEAGKILADAVAAGRKIAVWGDYDVDGVTATALALEVFKFHGVQADWHIPGRLDEGYGMNIAGVEALAKDGVQVLLTVDCGISEAETIARARELGMTVVVTDHHLPPETLPQADAICNPRIGKNACASLSGVGVIFYVMAEMNACLAKAGREKMDMRKTLDLVALGTLADVVDLEGQNRILVRNGLRMLSELPRPGISELKIASKFAPLAALTSEQVSFSLAPRINAAGRIASAEPALRLMLTQDFDEARSLAAKLDAFNTERRSQEERIFGEASALAEEQGEAPALILAGEAWHPGVIGIVASRIVERYNKPAFLLSRDGSEYKGSGRSVEGLNLHECLCECAGDLAAFGGHAMAAGLKLHAGSLQSFRRHFCDAVQARRGGSPAPAELSIDDDLDFSGAADFTFLKELQLMQPFGAGNPEPVFRSPVLLIERIRLFGKQRNHAQLDLLDGQSGIRLSAKAWRQAEQFPQEMAGRKIRLAYSPSIDMYNGVAHVDLRIQDWRMES